MGKVISISVDQQALTLMWEMNDTLSRRDLRFHEKVAALNASRQQLNKIGYTVFDVKPTEDNDFSYFELIPL